MHISSVIFLILVYLAAGVAVTFLLAKQGIFRTFRDNLGVGFMAMAMIVFWPFLAVVAGVNLLGKWLKAAEAKI